MFWWTEVNILTSNLSAAATYEHIDSASSPTHLQLRCGGRKPGEPGKRDPDIPRPLVLEDPRAGAASPEVALLKTPAPAPRTTKSHSELSVSSPTWGPAPSTTWVVVPCNVLLALGTSDTDAIIGRPGDVVTPSFKAKTECIHLCVPGSNFTHKTINSEINSITSVYYIESYYKTYYKTKRSKQRK
jgi:hypothetical protein